MKRWIQALIGGIAVCLMLSLCGFEGQCRDIREGVVRLHILANSDSRADQTVKLQVRDAVLQEAAGWLDGSRDGTEALEHIRRCLPALQAVAEKTVREAGYTYPVSVELCEMYFETRQYDAVTLPAGMYDAVRFTLGAGEGKNWWCVIYPPMCIRSAVEEQTLSDVLTDRQMSIVTGKRGFTVRLKIVEVLEWFIDKFR